MFSFFRRLIAFILIPCLLWDRAYAIPRLESSPRPISIFFSYQAVASAPIWLPSIAKNDSARFRMRREERRWFLGTLVKVVAGGFVAAKLTFGAAEFDGLRPMLLALLDPKTHHQSLTFLADTIRAIPDSADTILRELLGMELRAHMRSDRAAIEALNDAFKVLTSENPEPLAAIAMNEMLSPSLLTFALQHLEESPTMTKVVTGRALPENFSDGLFIPQQRDIVLKMIPLFTANDEKENQLLGTLVELIQLSDGLHDIVTREAARAVAVSRLRKYVDRSKRLPAIYFKESLGFDKPNALLGLLAELPESSLRLLLENEDPEVVRGVLGLLFIDYGQPPLHTPANIILKKLSLENSDRWKEVQEEWGKAESEQTDEESLLRAVLKEPLHTRSYRKETIDKVQEYLDGSGTPFLWDMLKKEKDPDIRRNLYRLLAAQQSEGEDPLSACLWIDALLKDPMLVDAALFWFSIVSIDNPYLNAVAYNAMSHIGSSTLGATLEGLTEWHDDLIRRAERNGWIPTSSNNTPIDPPLYTPLPSQPTSNQTKTIISKKPEASKPIPLTQRVVAKKLAPIGLTVLPEETFSRMEVFEFVSWTNSDLEMALANAPTMLPGFLRYVAMAGPRSDAANALRKIADINTRRTVLEAILVFQLDLFDAFGNEGNLLDILENGEDARAVSIAVQRLAAQAQPVTLGPTSRARLQQLSTDPQMNVAAQKVLQLPAPTLGDQLRQIVPLILLGLATADLLHSLCTGQVTGIATAALWFPFISKKDSIRFEAQRRARRWFLGTSAKVVAGGIVASKLSWADDTPAPIPDRIFKIDNLRPLLLELLDPRTEERALAILSDIARSTPDAVEPILRELLPMEVRAQVRNDQAAIRAIGKAVDRISVEKPKGMANLIFDQTLTSGELTSALRHLLAARDLAGVLEGRSLKKELIDGLFIPAQRDSLLQVIPYLKPAKLERDLMDTVLTLIQTADALGESSVRDNLRTMTRQRLLSDKSSLSAILEAYFFSSNIHTKRDVLILLGELPDVALAPLLEKDFIKRDTANILDDLLNDYQNPYLHDLVERVLQKLPLTGVEAWTEAQKEWPDSKASDEEEMELLRTILKGRPSTHSFSEDAKANVRDYFDKEIPDYFLVLAKNEKDILLRNSFFRMLLASLPHLGDSPQEIAIWLEGLRDPMTTAFALVYFCEISSPDPYLSGRIYEVASQLNPKQDIASAEDIWGWKDQILHEAERNGWVLPKPAPETADEIKQQMQWGVVNHRYRDALAKKEPNRNPFSSADRNANSMGEIVAHQFVLQAIPTLSKDAWMQATTFESLPWPQIFLGKTLLETPDMLPGLLAYIAFKGTQSDAAEALRDIEDLDTRRTVLEAILIFQPNLFDAFGNAENLLDILENGEDLRARGIVIARLAAKSGPITLGPRSRSVLQNLLTDPILGSAAQLLLNRPVPVAALRRREMRMPLTAA